MGHSMHALDWFDRKIDHDELLGFRVCSRVSKLMYQ